MIDLTLGLITASLPVLVGLMANSVRAVPKSHPDALLPEVPSSACLHSTAESRVRTKRSDHTMRSDMSNGNEIWVQDEIELTFQAISHTHPNADRGPKLNLLKRCRY